MAKKAKGTRGSSWTDEETECLLNLWQENDVENQLDDPKRNNVSIYQMLSCKIKMHTLKRSFRECKKNLKISGNGRKFCKFYTKLNDILGQRPASSPVKLIESVNRKRTISCIDDSESDTLDDTEDKNIDYTELLDDSNTDNKEPIASTANDNVNSNINDRRNEESTDGEKEKKGDEEIKESGKTKSKQHVKENKSSKIKPKKTRLEIALSTVMTAFADSNSKFETTLLALENKKTDAELKRIEIEKQRLESEERQKREEREHQYRMMQMIIGRMNAQHVLPQNIPSSSYDTHNPVPMPQHYISIPSISSPFSSTCTKTRGSFRSSEVVKNGACCDYGTGKFNTNIQSLLQTSPSTF
ncbi:DNA ligase 1-like [Gigantopelta aegis]|uniref:DNA ligase 1-like n=1 Tax=Gigantopelta aegis TaxID=1735272 RepID=UPI001B8879A9|nr:DNA ligase 1-like [Gigantopelta aegis]